MNSYQCHFPITYGLVALPLYNDQGCFIYILIIKYKPAHPSERSNMHNYNPSRTTVWVIIASVLAQAVIWLIWLYRFYLRPPREAFTICVGLAALTMGTVAIVVILVFGLQEAVGGKPPAFWLGVGYTISICLSATFMVCLVFYSSSHLLIRRASGLDHDRMERAAL